MVRQVGREAIGLDLASRSPSAVELFDRSGKRVATIRRSEGGFSETVDLRSLGLEDGVYTAVVRQYGLAASGNIAIAR
jgi:hypothetical protein